MRKVRREYGNRHLSRRDLINNPLELLKRWLDEAINMADIADPTAMVISTIDANGIPDSRVVLLKEIRQGCLIFYTNYQSRKAQQLASCGFAAANFYWPYLARQLRMRGKVSKTSLKLSDDYFHSRPYTSKISSIASPQSQEIPDRETLEKYYLQADKWAKKDKLVERPEYWGGYALSPFEIEFWQGRDNRLHDRFRYTLEDAENWKIVRLAP